MRKSIVKQAVERSRRNSELNFMEAQRAARDAQDELRNMPDEQLFGYEEEEAVSNR